MELYYVQTRSRHIHSSGARRATKRRAGCTKHTHKQMLGNGAYKVIGIVDLIRCNTPFQLGVWWCVMLVFCSHTQSQKIATYNNRFVCLRAHSLSAAIRLGGKSNIYAIYSIWGTLRDRHTHTLCKQHARTPSIWLQQYRDCQRR